MNSETAEHFDMPYAAVQWLGPGYMLEELENPNPWVGGEYKETDPEHQLPRNGRTYDEDIMRWIGLMYEFWHLRTGESSSGIYARADARAMAGYYDKYHMLDCEQAIDKIVGNH